MLSDRLKRETQQAHLSLEKILIPKIKAINSTPEYARVLEILYGFYKPVEDRIAHFVNQSHLADIDERRKAHWIIEDLKLMDAESSPALCTSLPAMHNTADALGAMYVLEGSTLGGRIICKMIANSLPSTANAGLHFFEGYGHLTVEKWNTFGSYINSFTGNFNEEDKMIAAATSTFITFKNWIEAN